MWKHVVAWTCNRLIPTVQDLWRIGFQKFTTVWGPAFQDRPRLLRFLEPMLFLAVFLLIGQAAWIYCGVQPVTGAGDKIRLNIPRGSTVTEVAKLLEEKGLINNSGSFVWFVYLTGRQNQIKAGNYFLEPGISFAELLKELKTGRPIIYRVTIPEGLRQDEITELLAARGLVERETFSALLRNEEFLRTYLPEFGPSSAEGFLFPDTYEFAEGMSEEEIAATFLRRFRRVWEEVAGRGVSDNFSLMDRVILASIVESEAKLAEERPIIASVFLNRLRKGYPLQSCATVLYALGERKSRLLYKDLEYDSPYNTYLHYGLPPGPISNPGRASLEAAFHPAETDFLYFVARPDGGHVFSRTYREHLNARNHIK